MNHFDVILSWDGSREKVLVNEKLQFTGTSNETEIHLQALAFKNSTIQNLTIQVNGSDIPVILSKNKNGLLVTTISAEVLTSLEINYETTITEKHIIVPLIFTTIVPPSNDEQLFSATIKIPDHHKLVESFPTIDEEGTIDGQQLKYVVKLPVIPSVIKFEVAPENDFRMGITEILDAVILITLIILGVVGWKNRKMLT